jgi:hypothetical protein
MFHAFCEQESDENNSQSWGNPWVRDFALRPQERGFKPGQLTQLIDYLAGGKVNGSWDPGGDIGEWLIRLCSSCPPLPNVANPLTAR